MSDFAITLVNRCDDDHDAKVLVYQSRAPGDAGDAQPPTMQEIEVRSGTQHALSLPAGPRYFFSVEDVGPGKLHPGKRDAIEVGETDKTVVVTGSIASGLRIALG